MFKPCGKRIHANILVVVYPCCQFLYPLKVPVTCPTQLTSGHFHLIQVMRQRLLIFVSLSSRHTTYNLVIKGRLEIISNHSFSSQLATLSLEDLVTGGPSKPQSRVEGGM